jgi:hypothetical protein
LVELENHFLTGFSDSCFSVIRIGFMSEDFLRIEPVKYSFGSFTASLSVSFSHSSSDNVEQFEMGPGLRETDRGNDGSAGCAVAAPAENLTLDEFCAIMNGGAAGSAKVVPTGRRMTAARRESERVRKSRNRRFKRQDAVNAAAQDAESTAQAAENAAQDAVNAAAQDADDVAQDAENTAAENAVTANAAIRVAADAAEQDATNAVEQDLAEVRTVAVAAAWLAQELKQAAASAWLVWDAARDAVYAMPEVVTVERENDTMDAEDVAEQAYREAQAAAGDALVAAEHAEEVLHST